LCLLQHASPHSAIGDCGLPSHHQDVALEEPIGYGYTGNEDKAGA